MGKLKITGRATLGTGPFTYLFEAVAPCTDITFTGPNGTTGVNSLSISSPNPSIVIQAEYEETACAEDNNLGTIRLTVTDSLNCVHISSTTATNKCKTLAANVYQGTSTTNNYTFYPVVTGEAASPITYKWTVSGNDSAVIDGSDCESTVEVYNPTKDGFTISVTVTDNNDCSTTGELVVPDKTEKPSVKSVSVMVPDGSTDAITIDMLSLIESSQNSISIKDLSVKTAASKGSYVLSGTTGILTYTPASAAETGVETLEFTAKDVFGAESNTGLISIAYDPSLDYPVIVADTAATACNTAVTIDVLANDTDADSNIDETTLEIIGGPFNGTAVVTSDYKIKYTPNTDFDGDDVIRYTVKDLDNLEADQGASNFVTITVAKCCDSHDADISITCAGVSAPTYTAAATGTLTGVAVSTDTLEVDTGGGYGAGTSGAIAIGCGSPTTTDYVNLSYTDASGNFTTGSGSLVKTDLGASQWKITINYGSKIAPAFANELAEFVNDAKKSNKIVQLTITGTTTDDFWGGAISNVVSGVNSLEFNYNAGATVTGACSANIAAITDPVASALTAGTDTPTSFTKLSEIEYGDPSNTVKFRRTIVRSDGCSDIVVEKEITLTDVNNFCDAAGYTISVLQAAGPGYEGDELSAWEVYINNEPTGNVTAVTVGGSNILSTTYNMPDQAQDLEDALQAYLDANDAGGTATVYTAGTNILIVRASSRLTWTSLTTSLGTTAFTDLS